MKRILSLVAAMLLLNACETNRQDKEAVERQLKADVKTAESNVEKHSVRVASNVRDSVKRTSMKLREWWLTPLPEERPRAVPASYCYKVLQDIVCYRDPVPGNTHNLVGWQGDGAKEPPVAQTLVMPMERVEAQNMANKGEERIKSAKPVFAAIPEREKKENEGQAVDATPTVGSEPLPDPTLSPQL
jgi:hypothetical protein